MFFSGVTSYVNFPIIVAYVKEVVRRKTVQGGGHEFGVTAEEIFNEIRFIFASQYGSCPISNLDVNKALSQLDNNGFPIFHCFTNFAGQLLWSISPYIANREPQKIYFEPIKVNPNSQMEKMEEIGQNIVKPKEKSGPSATIDFSLMLKDEKELEEEVERLKKKKLMIEKMNTKLRVTQRLLQNPKLLEEAVKQINTDHENLSEAYSQTSFHFMSAMTEIDSAIGF